MGTAAWSAAYPRPFALAAAPISRTIVRLGYVGYPCEAATFLAPSSPIFRRHGLEPQLVRFQTDDALIAALGSGKVDAASTNLPTLLKPLESGGALRVVAGLHAGCLRVLQRESLGIDTFGDFKGKIVGTDRLQGPAMNLLSAILHRQGVDPERDVTWRAYAGPDLESALDAKEVSYVAASDPLGYVLLSDHKAEPYIKTAGGGFSCGADVAPGHHCFLVLAGRLVETRRPIAAALTRSFLDATTSIGRGVGPAAVAEATGPIAADIHDALGMLSSYDWSPTTNVVLEELELTARDFRRAGLLRRSTNPEQLAAQAFVDILDAHAM
jgi:NitT/TauT family transport system substrate-binding protein